MGTFKKFAVHRQWEELHRIFGKYARHIAKEGLIAGRFTGHLESACFVFGDEAFWAGDKGARGALYGLITEPTITIEHKGRTPYDIRNPLKFIFASNHGWMVPAGPKARRWAVFDAAETYEQDKDTSRHSTMKSMGADLRLCWSTCWRST